MALSLINADLERISTQVFPIQRVRLDKLEVEIQKHVRSEKELEQEISEKTAVLESWQNKIKNFRSSIDQKTQMIAQQEETNVQLQKKLDGLKARLRELKNKEQNLSYDVMMKRHSIKETDDRSLKYLKLFLWLTSILAVILAVYFIVKK